MQRLFRAFAIALFSLGAAWLCAQYRVNPQIGAVNNQLYGGGSSGSVNSESVGQ